MKVGSVILYKGQVGIICEIQDGKILIEYFNEEVLTKKVREKDIFVLSEEPCNNLKEILEAQVPEVDFAESFEFFPEKASFLEIANLFYGDVSPSKLWPIWKAILASPYFKATVPIAPIFVLSPEEVIKLQEKEKQKQNEFVLYNEFLVETKAILKSINQSSTFKANTTLEEQKLYKDKTKYSVFFQELEQVAFGNIKRSKILVDLQKKQQSDVAHDLLLNLQFWPLEKNPFPVRAGLSLNEAKATVPKPTFEKKAVDLTHFTSYAIDNPESTDPDDAVAFENGTLYIHVACPAETIEYDSLIDEEACDRGSTIYLPERVIRMLDPNAVEYFALGLNEECYALTYEVKFDADFEISEADVYRSKIKVKRLTYEQADTQQETTLKPLFDLAKNIFKRRSKNGAVSIELPEVQLTVENKREVKIESHKTYESSKMIREMMLIAGEAGAMFAFKNQIPFQYISQERPTIPNKLPTGFAGEYQKRKHMRGRSVGTVPSKHFALGLSMYAQVTSPLRRYGDLIAQEQILRFIDKRSLISKDDFLLKLSRSEIAVKKIAQAVRLSKTHWTLVYLLNNSEKVFKAIVLDNSTLNHHIILPSLAFEIDMVLKQKKELNEVFNVMVKNISIPFQSCTLVEV